MQEETPTAEAAQEAPTTTDEPATFDADYVRSLRAEAARYRNEAKANADAAARLREIEDAQKSEAQKQAEALAVAQAEAEQARAEALRLKVGVAAGLPPEAIGRLQGSTEEELKADAAALASLLKPQAPTPPNTKPTSSLVSGSVSTDESAPTDINGWLRTAAARSRK